VPVNTDVDVGAEGGGVDARVEDLFDEEWLGKLVPLETAPMTRFFRALRELSGNRKKGLVRVLHYGDSHTAADFLPTAIRHALQKRFGDGGRGFVLLGKPWRSYSPVGVDNSAKGRWKTERIYASKDPALMDGRYGLGGVAVESKQKGAAATMATSRKSPFGSRISRFEVFYLKQPGGGSFSLLVDYHKKRTIRTKSNRIKSGFFELDVEEGPHSFGVRVKGDGKVRLFGVVAENDGPGIVYDALGINGAFFYTSLRWDKAVLKDQVRRRDPALIVTMYGANDAESRSLDETTYLRRIEKSLSRIREGAPNASCLMLGPPDRIVDKPPVEDKPRLDLVVEVQEMAAEEAGCGFIDLRALMGGAGAFERWREKGLAQSDGIHLSSEGYRILGELIGQRILSAYDTYRKKTGPSRARAKSSKRPRRVKSGDKRDRRKR
jgi:lysophospholipase L1-like esterase